MDLINENRRMEIGPESLNDLNTTRKWTMFLAILGFIWMAFLVIGIIAVGAFLPIMGTPIGLGGLEIGLVIAILIGMAILYFFPLLYLYRFSASTKKAVESLQPADLASGFRNLRSFFRFIGILTIVFIVLYILILVGGLAATLFTAL